MRKIISIILAMMFILIPVSAFAEVNVQEKGKTLPSYYFDECPVHGTINIDTFQQDQWNGEIYVWTPYNYDESGKTKYEVILLLHGGGGNLRDWMDGQHWVFVDSNYKDARLFNIYDWMSYKKDCKPFIVCAINNRQDRELVSQEIIKAFSFVAENYHTYAEDGLEEDIIAEREHFTLGGLSNGARTVFYFMSYHPEYAGNYIALSMSRDKAYDASFLEKIVQYPLLNYFGGAGVKDKYGHGTRDVLDELFYAQYAERSTYVDYPWGHDWNTWTYGIFDALTYIFSNKVTDVFKKTLHSIVVQVTTA